MADRNIITCDVCEREIPLRHRITVGFTGTRLGQHSYRRLRTTWWYGLNRERDTIHDVCDECWNEMSRILRELREEVRRA